LKDKYGNLLKIMIDFIPCI